MAKIGNTATAMTPKGITFSSLNHTVTIDLQKYGDKLIEFFRSMGVEEKAVKTMYSKEFLKKIEQARKEKEAGTLHRVDPNNIWG
ncbi:MAG: hypothetical protein NC038_08015 [Paludibacter sp.]|nr:hypothetical protein [Bacteroidales bacterium]MCM1069905.1 hypothetical protein [Prevotella sp.]MCM1354586.1 hypothetical protein [Bacteroides sp.]MCM1443481.1 hypothetical protein [Muribaculum sp.]MCM1482564.1 hypothetical protein [Paludibacter sp.]